jgi:TP901 family phage tail tape measure protein
MIELSKKLMVPTAELNKIAQSAAQAGVTGVQNITAFTEVVAKLTRTTSLTADTAADAILELVNVTKYPIDQLGHLGDIITKVGKSSVGSESKVLELATEVAKAGAAFGFTAPKALAWAGALADTGQNAESAATAVVQSIQKIGKVILEGGPAFSQLAKFIGMTDEQLKTTFEKDGPAVLKAFLAQLGQANGSFEQMQDLAGAGIINVRSQRVVEAMATALQKLTQHEKEAADANGELNEKFDKLGETALRQLEGIKTNFQAIGITIGNSILGPVSTMISGIREITTATNGWANAFQALSFIASQFVLLWTVKFSLTKMKELLGLTTVATAELATAQGAAAVTGTAMAGAETAISTQTAVMATEVGLAARAVGLLGLAFKALWPILAVEAIVYAIGKINELQNAAQQAASKARAQGAGAYAGEIKDSISGGGFTSRAEERKLLGLRDNAAGQLLKYQMLQGKDDASTGGYPTGTYDKQIVEAQQKLDAHKGALAEFYAATKKATEASAAAVDTITKNGPLVAVSKDTQGALNLLENQINKVKDLKKELDVLHTQGIEAYKSTKISDTASEAAGRKLGGKKSPQQVLADAQESGFFDPSQLKPLQDAVSSSNWSAAKLAIADLSKVLADMEGHYKTSAQEAVRSSSKIASASERAENAIIRQFTQSDAALQASMDILNSSDEGTFKMSQASKRATEDVARLRLELSKMTKGDLVEMAKVLGMNTTDLDAMAKSLYDTETASQAAANGIKLVNEAIADNHRLQLDATKRKDKLAQQSSQLGMSDYDKQIAQYGFDASEPYKMENEKIASQIADLNKERDAAVAQGDAKAIAAIDATVRQLQKQIHTTEELDQVTKEAGQDFKKFLDKSIETQRLTATMDTLRDSFVQFGTEAIMNFDNIGDAFASMLKQMAVAILQNQVLGPLSDMLFGRKGDSTFGGGGGGSDFSSIIGTSLSIAAFLADGGPVTPGKNYIVGENGPEIFSPSTSGQIISNNDAFGPSPMAMGMGSGSSTIHIVLEASSEFDARIANVSGSVANQVVMSYDKKKLPGRVGQLTSDARFR